jgi:hypothetical protein
MLLVLASGCMSAADDVAIHAPAALLLMLLPGAAAGTSPTCCC